MTHVTHLGGVTVRSPRGFTHGQGHVLDGALSDGDAVDQLLRGGVHGVHPTHHVLQVHRYLCRDGVTSCSDRMK